MSDPLCDLYRQSKGFKKLATLGEMHEWAANEISYLRQTQNMLSDMHAAAINELAITREDLAAADAMLKSAHS